MRDVAVDTRGVPDAGRRGRSIHRWPEKHHVSWNPSTVRDDVGGGNLSNHTAAVRAIPVHLLMMRSGDHDHLPRDARRCVAERIAVWVVEFRPELVATPLQAHRLSLHVRDTCAVEIGFDGRWRCDLGHRAM